MLPVLLAQLAARWRAAATLLLLAAAGVAAAASVPLFAEATQRAAIESVLAEDPFRQRVVSLPITVEGGPWEQRVPVGEYTAALAELSSFTPVVTHELQVHGLPPGVRPPSELHRLIGRDGFCGKVVFQAGRCPAGTREVALPAALAEVAQRRVGDVVSLTPMVRTDRGPEPQGPPFTITIAGVFEAIDPHDPFWWAGLDPLAALGTSPAVLASPALLRTIEQHTEVVMFEAILPEEALTPRQLPALRAQLRAADDRLAGSGEGFGGGTGGALRGGVLSLLDEVAAQGAGARALLPVVAAPVVALSWLACFAAVAAGLAARRRELAMVALRGATLPGRLVVVGAESILPLLAAPVVGLAAAHLLVRLVAGAGTPAVVDRPQLVAVGIVLAGALAAALVALVRELASPVAGLLRQVRPRRRVVGWGIDAVVVGLAVVIVIDLRWFDRELAGLMVAAPAVVMLAVAVLLARSAGPVSALVGRWSLRRGALGPALAALSLARRPGTAWNVVVLGLVVATVGLAVASVDVAGRGRAEQAAQLLGADRVLTVAAVEPGRLLHAVRSADPTGQYAMASVSMPATSSDPARRAVDSTRLAAVSHWSDRYGPATAQPLVELLRPPMPEPLTIGDGELVAELSTTELVPGERTLSVAVLLGPPTGGESAVVFDQVAGDRQRYTAEVTGCGGGCRLAGLSVTLHEAGSSQRQQSTRFNVVLHEFTSAGEPVFAQGPPVDRWRRDGGVEERHPLRLDPAGGGMEISHPMPDTEHPYRLLLAGAPDPLPVIAAGTPPARQLMSNLDGRSMPVAQVAEVPALPGLPAGGLLVDLEYAGWSAPEAVMPAEVWLAPRAPDSVVAALRAEGLDIRDDRRLAEVRAGLESTGTAMAVRSFLLAAGLAVIVGGLAVGLAAGTGDRYAGATGTPDAVALRRQGLPARTGRWAGRLAFGVAALAATVVGAVAAAVSWLAAGDRLPLGVDPTALPDRPSWTVMAAWLAAVALGLLAVAPLALRRGTFAESAERRNRHAPMKG